MKETIGDQPLELPADALTIGLEPSEACTQALTRYPEQSVGGTKLLLWYVPLPDIPGEVSIGSELGDAWYADADPRVPGQMVVDGDYGVGVASGVVNAVSLSDEGVVSGTYDVELLDGRRFKGDFAVQFVDHTRIAGE